MYGQDVYYLPRSVVNKDTIFGDDIPSKFSSAYKIEMYIENVDGFAGEGHLFSKFGIEVRDQATFVVARRRWKQTVSSLNNEIDGDVPREGDLIYLPLSKSIFQIMFVERQNPFYQVSNLNVVRLECELFEYNDEELDTGISDIDSIETLGYTVELLLDSDSDSVALSTGDIATQTLSDGTLIRSEIVEWDRSRQRLNVAHIGSSDGKFHNYTTGGTLTFADAAGSRIIRGVEEDLGDFDYQNVAFDSDVDPFLVFDENNPFGDPE